MKIYREFLRNETGAITVDWVALTAGILLLGIMVVYAIFNGGVSSLVADVNATLASVDTDVDVGIEPALYDMVLASGDELPTGSVVIGTEALTVTDPITGVVSASGVVETTFELPDGSTVATTELNSATNIASTGDMGGGVTDFAVGGLPVGTTVSSGNSLTLPDGGGTVTQSSLTGDLPPT